MEIKFTGRDDLRILAAADLKKAGVENFTKTSFPKGQAVEVDDEVAKALLATPEIFGQFAKVERDAQADTEAKAEKATQSAVDATPTEAASTSDVPATRPSGRASTKSS